MFDLDGRHARSEIASKRRIDLRSLFRRAVQNDAGRCQQVAQAQFETYATQCRGTRISGLRRIAPRGADLFAGHLDGLDDGGTLLRQPGVIGRINCRRSDPVDDALAECGRGQKTEQTKNRVCEQVATSQPKLLPDGWIRPFISAGWVRA